MKKNVFENIFTVVDVIFMPFIVIHRSGNVLKRYFDGFGETLIQSPAFLKHYFQPLALHIPPHLSNHSIRTSEEYHE